MAQRTGFMRALSCAPFNLLIPAALLILSALCCGGIVSVVRTALAPLGVVHSQPGLRQELAATVRRMSPSLPVVIQPGSYLVAMSAQENRLKCRNEATFSLPFRERDAILPEIAEAQQAFDCRTFQGTLARGVEIEHQVTDAAGFTFSTRTTAADCARLALARLSH
jgi:hypothetical protein